jgi:hypothetical protein
MLGDCAESHVEVPCDVSGGKLAVPDQGEDLASSRLGYDL